MSECVLKTLACRGLRVGPSKSKEPPDIPPTRERGVSTQESPFPYRPPRENGVFELSRPFLALGKWGYFSTPRPSFPFLGGFDLRVPLLRDWRYYFVQRSL